MSAVPTPSGSFPFHDADKLRNEWLGDWTIAFSTLKMWTDGKRLRPGYRYATTDTPGVITDTTYADDVVDAAANPPTTKPNSMSGTNTQHKDAPSVFTWRGHGWLRLVSMDWRIVHYDPNRGIGATCFTKTFHSEAACSVIVRDPSKVGRDEVTDAGLREAMEAIRRQSDFPTMGPLRPAAGSKWAA